MSTNLRVGLTLLLICSYVNVVSAETSEDLYKTVLSSLINSNCYGAKKHFEELKSREQGSIDQGNVEFWNRLEALVNKCRHRTKKSEIKANEKVASVEGGGGKADGISVVGGGGSAEMASKEVLPELTNMGQQEPDTDRMGLDYTSFNLPLAKPRLCQDACAGDSKCQAYTYVKPGVQDDYYARCWLKHSIPQSKMSSCCVSGVKN